MRRLKPIVIELLTIAVLVAGGYWLYQNHNQLLDWLYLRSYKPPARVAALANKATLTDYGQRLFYRASPEITSKRDDLVNKCRIPSDKTIELGCYLSGDK